MSASVEGRIEPFPSAVWQGRNYAASAWRSLVVAANGKLLRCDAGQFVVAVGAVSMLRFRISTARK
jgi:hypothetical protein